MSEAGRPHWIDADTLLDAAQERCGLRDFEDPTFLDRLGIFVDVLNAKDFSPEAQVLVIDQVAENLVARLRIAEQRMRDPGVAAERIERPLIITGLPRSGTTLLHSLVSEDPTSRAIRLAEAFDPSLPGDLAAADPARLRELDARNDRFLEAIPRMIQAHPYLDMGAQSLMECESWLALDFRNTYPNFFHRAQMSLEALGDDPTGNYAFHRAFLQHRQHGTAPRRWALKGTEHHYNLEVLRSTYPDAHVVWIHRDPMSVIPSYLELLAMMRETLVGELDRRAMASEALPHIAGRIEALLSNPLVGSDFVCHIHYQDLMKDSARVVRALYDRFDIRYTKAFDERLQAWGSGNTVTRHGKWEYSLDSFGIGTDDVEKYFRGYADRFGIPREAA